MINLCFGTAYILLDNNLVLCEIYIQILRQLFLYKLFWLNRLNETSSKILQKHHTVFSCLSNAMYNQIILYGKNANNSVETKQLWICIFCSHWRIML